MTVDYACTWEIPPADLTLARDDVHLWLLELDQPEECAQSLLQILSPDEIERADRFLFEKDKRHFIIGRAWLRILLGNYIHVKPGEVRLCYGHYGKPLVSSLSSNDVLHFNLSHSEGIALYAFALNREIGVDVEYMQQFHEAEQIVAYFFSTEEKAVFFKMPANQQRQTFFKSWTQKEAYLKAIGEGLSRSLDEITVSLAPNEPAKLLRVQGKPDEPLRWNLQTFRPAPDYLATLAVEGKNWKLACWQGVQDR